MTDGGTAPASRPPPEPFEPNAELPVEQLDLGPEHALTGITLAATFSWGDMAGPLDVPDADPKAIASAHALLELRWQIEIAALGRMRVVFDGPAHPLALGSELRMRHERYGSLLLWPGGAQYRVIPSGALRTTLNELRVDATPLVEGSVTAKEKGTRLGFPSRTVEVRGRFGAVDLELAEQREAGDGGPLLCRTLLELIAVDPASSVCQPSEFPVMASFRWSEGGTLRFEVRSVERHDALDPDGFAMVPEGAVRVQSGLPEPPEPLLPATALLAFRSGDAPDGPVLAVNRGDRASYVFIDGVPLGSVGANRQRRLGSLKSSHYRVEWRSFLGDDMTAGSEVTLPGRLVRTPERDGP